MTISLNPFKNCKNEKVLFFLEISYNIFRKFANPCDSLWSPSHLVQKTQIWPVFAKNWQIMAPRSLFGWLFWVAHQRFSQCSVFPLNSIWKGTLKNKIFPGLHEHTLFVTQSSFSLMINKALLEFEREVGSNCCF